MLRLLDDHPLEDGYIRVMEPMIHNLSIKDMWDCFYADDASNFITDIPKQFNDDVMVLNITDWGPVTEDKFKRAFGFDVKRMKEGWMTADPERVPFAKDVYS